jgi:hypothetical protein
MILTYCVELTSQWKIGPGIVQSNLSMDGRVTVIVPNIDVVSILVSLFLDYIDGCSIFNPKPSVSIL